RLDPDTRNAAIDEARDMPQPAFAHREIGGEVGEEELDALKLDDPPPRLPPLVDVVDGVVERRPGDAERVRRDARPRLVERRQEERQPLPGLAEQIGPRDPAPVEPERAGRRGAMPELVLLA